MNWGRPGFDLWVGKIPWRRERLLTPVFLLKEFHGLYSPWGHRVAHDWATFKFTFTLLACVMSVIVQLFEHSLALSFLWNWDENWLFKSCCHCWVFQVCWHIECSTLPSSSFRNWHSSAGISSLLLALFTVMLPKAYLISHSRMSGSRWVITS